jgi:carbamoyltransferase
MTDILGLSAYYHDSAAAILHDGEVVAAAQQERFSWRKHGAGFPAETIAYCLAYARIDSLQLLERPPVRDHRLKP